MGGGQITRRRVTIESRRGETWMWNFGQWEEGEGRRLSTSEAEAERDLTFREMLDELRAQTRQNADILAVMQRQWRARRRPAPKSCGAKTSSSRNSDKN